jgi:hypothetical protein
MKITQLELTDFRKGIVALVGAAGEAVNFGLITGATARWVGIIIAAATAAGVVAVPNSHPTVSPVVPAPPVPPPPSVLPGVPG